MIGASRHEGLGLGESPSPSLRSQTQNGGTHCVSWCVVMYIIFSVCVWPVNQHMEIPLFEESRISFRTCPLLCIITLSILSLHVFIEVHCTTLMMVCDRNEQRMGLISNDCQT